MQGYVVVKKTINWAALMEESDESHIEAIRWYCRMNKYSVRKPPLMLYEAIIPRKRINQDY